MSFELGTIYEEFAEYGGKNAFIGLKFLIPAGTEEEATFIKQTIVSRDIDPRDGKVVRTEIDPETSNINCLET